MNSTVHAINTHGSVNADHIYRFLSFIVEAQKPVWENQGMYLELTNSHKSNLKKLITQSVPYYDGLAEYTANLLAQISALHDNNIWVGIVPRIVPVRKHAKKAETAGGTCVLWLDFDHVDRGRVQEIIDRLPFKPTMVVWSGHGVHIYFQLSAPIDADIAEIIMENLAKETGADDCHDINRMLRIAGTMNHKLKKDSETNTEEKLESVPCFIIEHTGVMYKPEDFSKWITQTTVGNYSQANQTSQNAYKPDVQAIRDAIECDTDFLYLEKRVLTLSPRMQRIIFDGVDPEGTPLTQLGDPDYSRLMQIAVTAMVAQGWSDSEIAQVLACSAFNIYNRVRKKLQQGGVNAAVDDIRRSIEKAHVRISQERAQLAQLKQQVQQWPLSQQIQKQQPSQPQTRINVSWDEARTKVNEVLNEETMNLDDKHHAIANILFKYFLNNGTFIYFPDEDTNQSSSLIACKDSIFYLDNEKNLFRITDDDMDAILKTQCGLSSSKGIHSSIREFFKDHIAMQYKSFIRAEFNRVGVYKKETNAFYMAQGKKRICKITTDKIETVPLGTDGVFFLSEEGEQPWVYLDHHQGNLLHNIFPVSIDPRSVLTEDEARLTVLNWMVANFMRGMINHYALLNLIGEPGSGKTTLAEDIVRLITGNKKYKASGQPREERDFYTAVKNCGTLVFDNIEGHRYKWDFESALARTYQGGSTSARKLYTDHTEIRFRSNTFICLTAINPGWGRGDVAERSIVLQLAPWMKNKGNCDFTLEEHIEFLMDHRDEILTEVANSLQKLLQYLEVHPLREHKVKHRMESYPMVLSAWCAANSIMDKEQFEKYWHKLTDEQTNLMGMSSDILILFEEFIEALIEEERNPSPLSITKSLLLEQSRLEQQVIYVKGTELYKYLKNTYQELMDSFDKYSKFCKAIKNSKNLMERIGIKINNDKRFDHGSMRCWAIDYRQYHEHITHSLSKDFTGTEEEIVIELPPTAIQ